VDTVRSEAAKGDVVAVLYSNPNNPTGSTYGEENLVALADICVEHDVIAIEDLAYLFMDYTKDYTVPGRPPYIQTIATCMRKRGRYILLYSLSKFAAYAGQGVGVVKLSRTMDETPIDAMPLPLTKATGAAKFGELFPMAIYAMTARVPHSAQVAAAKIFEMANTGRLSGYLSEMRAEYGHRVRRALELFERNGFTLAYPVERSEEGVGAALYVTLVHPHYAHGGVLTKDLLCFGIGVSTVASCGGKKAAIRFSVSDVDRRRLEQLEARLAKFAEFRRAAANLIARGVPVEKTHAIACS
jgi:aspartate/methionine/tyrosine aminotransferase